MTRNTEFAERYEDLKAHAYVLERMIMYGVKGDEYFSGNLKRYREEMEKTQKELAIYYLVDRVFINPPPPRPKPSDLEPIMETLRKAERYYYGVEIPKVKRQLDEMRRDHKHEYPEARLSNGCTYDEIQRARNYPMERLLEIGRSGRIRCVNPEHEDKSPSMLVRNNYAYCFACHFHADTIDVYMILNHCTFPEAVRGLNV